MNNDSQKGELIITYGKNGKVTRNNKKINPKTIYYLIPNEDNRFLVVPNKGYQIDSITKNGVNTKSIINNGEFRVDFTTDRSIINVTFKKIKNTWNRDEVISVLKKLNLDPEWVSDNLL